MKKLLRLDASLRKEGSHSRALADFFVTNWRNKYPTGEVVYRDLSLSQIPHLQNETVEAFHIPKEKHSEKNKQATILSDIFIEELQSVDHILISSPLYNLNVPSTLKSYLDYIVRAGYTFSVNEDGSYKGLLKNDAAYIITTKGETYKGTPMEALDFQEPYLKTIFSFIGLELKSVFSLEATAHPKILEKNIKVQQERIVQEFTNN